MGNNAREEIMDLDLNLDPSDPSHGSVLGLGSLLNELEIAHGHIEECIRQLEAVTSRARQRQRWRQGQSNSQMVNVSLEPTVSNVPSEGLFLGSMGAASNKDALKNRNITHIRPCSLKHSSKQCWEACKAMCTGNDGPCLCDTWVFCGNKKSCGSRFGECWLKKQKDILAPDRQEAGQKVMRTSGLIFGKGQPVASRESFVPENKKIRINGSTNNCDEVDDIICSRSTQDKRLRKTRTVKEPILQHVKRQKSLAICV